MNATFMIIYFLYATIMLLLVVGGVFYLLRKWYYSRHTEKTKRFVAKVFRSHGALRGWKLLNNVTIGEGEQAVIVDHMVVAPFGVMLACDLHRRGNAYGELDADSWIMVVGEDGKEKSRQTIESPYRKVRLAEEQLRRLFAKSKIYSVPIEVIVPKTTKQQGYITGSGEYMLSRKELKAHIARGKYDKDNGVKPEQIVALFEGK